MWISSARAVFANVKPNLMGYVYAEIELINSFDVPDARRHSIGEEEIRRTRVTMPS
jgi:hypothetical protein